MPISLICVCVKFVIRRSSQFYNTQRTWQPSWWGRNVWSYSIVCRSHPSCKSKAPYCGFEPNQFIYISVLRPWARCFIPNYLTPIRKFYRTKPYLQDLYILSHLQEVHLPYNHQTENHWPLLVRKKAFVRVAPRSLDVWNSHFDGRKKKVLHRINT